MLCPPSQGKCWAWPRAGSSWDVPAQRGEARFPASPVVKMNLQLDSDLLESCFHKAPENCLLSPNPGQVPCGTGRANGSSIPGILPQPGHTCHSLAVLFAGMVGHTQAFPPGISALAAVFSQGDPGDGPGSSTDPSSTVGQCHPDLPKRCSQMFWRKGL